MLSVLDFFFFHTPTCGAIFIIMSILVPCVDAVDYTTFFSANLIKVRLFFGELFPCDKREERCQTKRPQDISMYQDVIFACSTCTCVSINILSG